MMPLPEEHLRIDMASYSKRIKRIQVINEKWKIRDEEKKKEIVRKSNRKIKRWF